jgi:GGDEF domain-containing protein
MPDVTYLVPKGASPRVVIGGDKAPNLPDFDRRQGEGLRDPVTALPLTALLLDRVAVAIVRAQRANRRIAVLVLSNIRSCTAINTVDLRSLAQVLQRRLRPEDTVALVGDSALVVVCDAIVSDEEARRIARRMTEDTGIVCRIGITLSGAQRDPELVVARALEHLSPPRRRSTDAPDVA